MKTVKPFIPLLFLILLITCTKEAIVVRDYPRLGHTTITSINAGGVTVDAELLTLGNTPILDHGFIWNEAINLTLTTSEILSLGTQVSKGTFGGIINRAMRAKTTYHIRPFVKTEQFVVYGEELSFTSLGSNSPSIEKITPNLVAWGDTVIIEGKNFASKQNNNVNIAHEKATVLSATDTLLKVIIPYNITVLRPEVRVEVVGNSGTSISYVSMKPHIIERFEPSSGTLNDTITIYGKFPYTQPEVFVGNKLASVITFAQDAISFRVPPGLPKGENLLTVRNGEIEGIATQKFIRTSPEILTLTPKEIGYTDTLTIIGNSFGLQNNSNQVMIGGATAEIISTKKDTIKVKMPWGNYATSNPTVEVYYNEQTGTSVNKLIIKPLHITSFTPQDIVYPGESITVKGGNFGFLYNEMSPPNGLTIDGISPEILFSSISEVKFRLSVLTQNNEPLIKITSAGNSAETKTSFKCPWKKINSFPFDNGITKAATFSIGTNGYVVTGFSADSSQPNKKFTRFSQGTMQWETLQDFPGTARYDAFGIEFQGKGYLLGGRSSNRPLSDFWVYDDQENMWTEKGIVPFHAIGGAVINNDLYILSNERYTLDGNGNVVGFAGESGLWKYNLSTNSWEQMQQPGFTPDQDRRFYFELNNILYTGIKTGFSDYNLYKFNPGDQTWTLLGTTPFSVGTAPVGFSVSGSGYVMDGSGFYKYSPDSNSWLKLSPELSFIWNGGYLSHFKLGNQVYVGLGEYNTNFYRYPYFAPYKDLFFEFTALE